MQKRLGTPNRAGKSYPKARSIASSGRASKSLPQGQIHRFFWAVQPAVRQAHSQPTGTPRPHQWLLLGVQACRLPAPKPLKPLKPLKLCKSVSERPTAQAKATPKATSMASSWRCKSSRFANPLHFKRFNVFLACLIPQPTGTPRPHQWLLMGVQACRLPGLTERLKRAKTIPKRGPCLVRQAFAANRHPKATSMASYGRPSLPCARP